MRVSFHKYLIGAAALGVLVAGAAEAASTKLHTMKVATPDGAVVHVAYTGDVAPKVEVVPAHAGTAAGLDLADFDPFARMDRISAMIDAQMNAMMQRAAILQRQAWQMHQQAVAAGQGAQVAPGVTLAGAQGGALPRGVRVSYYSSSTDANGCTRTTSYSSDGSGGQPKVTQAASDSCDAAKPGTAAIPAKAEKPAADRTAPGQKV